MFNDIINPMLCYTYSVCKLVLLLVFWFVYFLKPILTVFLTVRNFTSVFYRCYLVRTLSMPNGQGK